MTATSGRPLLRRPIARSYAAILSLFACAFLLRVAGQFLVACFDVGFLPPMAEWYSGLVPYPALLPMQIAILAVQAKISTDVWSGRGYFATFRPRAGRLLCRLSYVYFAVTLVRYGLVMWFHPEDRWFHGTIPIFFHWVLAGYLFTLGKYFRTPNE